MSRDVKLLPAIVSPSSMYRLPFLNDQAQDPNTGIPKLVSYFNAGTQNLVMVAPLLRRDSYINPRMVSVPLFQMDILTQVRKSG